MSGNLSLRIYKNPQKTLTALLKPLYIFSIDPFVNRKKWLEQLKIALFDPQERTKELFEKMAIPFVEIDNVDAIAEFNKGFLVVGEGVSFEDYPSLPKIMRKVAAAGTPVLCLAPTSGTFTIFGSEEENLPRLQSMNLRRNKVITSLHKKLDALAWPPEGKVVKSSLVIKGEDELVIGKVVPEDKGWPFLEMNFGNNGKWVICGFAIISKWEQSPTPRFFFACIVKWMTKNKL